MSTPWWNEKTPGPSNPPARTPFWKTVRGSPKKPRIGCCLSNGLSGQLYADAPPATASVVANASTASPSRRERSMVTPPLWDAGRTPRLGAHHAGAVVNAEPLRVRAAVAADVDGGDDELVHAVLEAPRI